jgi:hypothetical protein
MKLFRCDACEQVVHFENSQCTRCGHALAYLPEHAVVSALEPVAGTPGTFTALAPAARAGRHRLCANQVDHGACNWAVPENDGHRFCRSCRLNELIPNLSVPGAREAWFKLEQAKRRLVYSLLELGLPVAPRNENPAGLAFEFKADQPGDDKVMIGHEDGVITINVNETDSPFREKTRLELNEPYRTLLNHFRHESEHYYWDRLVADSPMRDPFRRLFGDERASYADAQQAHYRDGAPKDWQSRFVSSYASMHPWEDWAESWAHYLHVTDTLGTARSFGVDLSPRPARAAGAASVAPTGELELHARRIDFEEFDDLVQAWGPLTVALNALNRSMGLPDSYPFVLSEPAIEKIRFVHDVIERSRLC